MFDASADEVAVVYILDESGDEVAVNEPYLLGGVVRIQPMAVERHHESHLPRP